VGWGALTAWSNRAAYDATAESSFYVAESFRGVGIGRALKKRLIEEARRLEFHTLLARTTEESSASIHLNESFGFEYIGTMKEVGFKFGQRLDVHMMQLMLGEAESDPTSPVADANVGDRPPRSHRDLGTSVLESAITSFRSKKVWADKAVAQLSDDQLHVALDANTNSVAIMMKHVAGNLLSRWTDFLTTDGEKPWRNRDDEFVDSFASREELWSHWERGWDCLFKTLTALKPDVLTKTVTIRGEPHSVPLAIHRSLAHCAYHTGQIVMLARSLAGDDWETITIPRGESESYNKAVWGNRGLPSEDASD
jgi:L-amino acid N-acyltransferase YncA